MGSTESRINSKSIGARPQASVGNALCGIPSPVYTRSTVRPVYAHNPSSGSLGAAELPFPGNTAKHFFNGLLISPEADQTHVVALRKITSKSADFVQHVLPQVVRPNVFVADYLGQFF